MTKSMSDGSKGTQARLHRLPLNLARWLQIILIAMIVFTLAFPAEAQGLSPQDGINRVVDVFRQLGGMFIQAAFSLMFVVFAVGSVKNGLGAQIAYQFGISHRMSADLLNLAGGVIIFALGLMTLTVAKFIIGQMAGMYDTTLELPRPTITIQ